MNLFNSDTNPQDLALLFSAMSRNPNQFGNTFNLLNTLDNRDRKERQEARKESLARNYLSSAGVLNGTPGTTQQAPDISDQMFSNVGPNIDTNKFNLGKAVGFGNLLNSQLASIAKANEPYDLAPGAVRMQGGQVIGRNDTVPLSDFAKDLKASGIDPDSAEGRKAMADHRAKQDFIPGQSPDDLALKRAQTAAALAKADADKGKANMLSDIPEGVTGKDVLELLSPIERAQIEGIVSGAQQMPRGTNNAKAQRIGGLVQLVDPSYTGARYTTNQDYRPGGRAGQNLAAANTAIQHLYSMAEAAKSLGNVGTPLVGKVYNYAQQGVKTSGSNPALKAFNTAKENAASELVKLFRGTGGDAHSVQEWRNNFSNLSSPEEIAAATNEALSLLDGRVDSMAFGYNNVMNTNKTANDFLSPKAREMMGRLRGTPSADSPQVPQAPQATSAQPQMPAGMVRQVGTYQGKPVYVDAQGQRHVAN